MTLLQLRFLREIARQSLSMSAAARVLNTSQPSISRQIQQLEAELGLELLARQRNRITGFTEAGHAVLVMATRLICEMENIQSYAADRSGQQGRLTLATSHLHARFTLAKPVVAFNHAHPGVTLHMRQVEPNAITRLVADGEADIGISTERTTDHPSLFLVPLGLLHRSLITPKGHPLARARSITLADVARFPIVGYNERSRTGELLESAFRAAGLEPRHVVSGSDADVIKVYVAAGLGVAIVPTVALDGSAPALAARDVTKMLPRTQTVLSMRRNAYLPRHLVAFVRILAPQWNRTRLENSMAAGHTIARPTDDIKGPVA
jgi:LysR family transcriptional regulator, cys regulon transcriptional activator